MSGVKINYEVHKPEGYITFNELEAGDFFVFLGQSSVCLKRSQKGDRCEWWNFEEGIDEEDLYKYGNISRQVIKLQGEINLKDDIFLGKKEVS